MALAGDPAARRYAESIGVAVPALLLVVVVRTSWPDDATNKRSDALDITWHRHRAAATWHRPGELVALLSADRQSSALAMARDVADVTGRPCAVGTATGPLSALSETHATAQRVSQVARTHTRPDHLYTVADVFIEIGVARLPDIDQWLRALTRRLVAGPDLIPTIETYYRHDLDRARTATTLNIHPGTLDYRLDRAHELTGIDPHTTHGIRVFTAALTLHHSSSR